MPGISASLHPGDLVNIEGVSDPGNYSPILLASNATVIGTAPLPEAQPATLFQLATGQEGSQWIEVRGVVRSVAFTNGLAQLGLRVPIAGRHRAHQGSLRDTVFQTPDDGSHHVGLFFG